MWQYEQESKLLPWPLWRASLFWRRGLFAMLVRLKNWYHYQQMAMNYSSTQIATRPTPESFWAFGYLIVKNNYGAKEKMQRATKPRNLSTGARRDLSTPKTTSVNYPRLLQPESVANGNFSVRGKTLNSHPLRVATKMPHELASSCTTAWQRPRCMGRGSFANVVLDCCLLGLYSSMSR